MLNDLSWETICDQSSLSMADFAAIDSGSEKSFNNGFIRAPKKYKTTGCYEYYNMTKEFGGENRILTVRLTGIDTDEKRRDMIDTMN